MRHAWLKMIAAVVMVLALTTPVAAQSDGDGDQSSAGDPYFLSILVQNCDAAPAEDCAPGLGAFFNVTSDSGEFLGNCEATRTSGGYAMCTVNVPDGITGVVTEDLDSIPGYAPASGANAQPFTAGSNAAGETRSPIFVNVLQTGGDVSALPNTGAGSLTVGSTLSGASLLAVLLLIAGAVMRKATWELSAPR